MYFKSHLHILSSQVQQNELGPAFMQHIFTADQGVIHLILSSTVHITEDIMLEATEPKWNKLTGYFLCMLKIIAGNFYFYKLCCWPDGGFFELITAAGRALDTDPTLLLTMQSENHLWPLGMIDLLHI